MLFNGKDFRKSHVSFHLSLFNEKRYKGLVLFHFLRTLSKMILSSSVFQFKQINEMILLALEQIEARVNLSLNRAGNVIKHETRISFVWSNLLKK